MQIAAHGGTSLSKKSGSASLATELSSSIVTSSRWPLVGFRPRGRVPSPKKRPDTMGRILLAQLWSLSSRASAASGFPAPASERMSRLQSTRRPNSSKDTRPRVSPAAKAAQSTQREAPMMQTRRWPTLSSASASPTEDGRLKTTSPHDTSRGAPASSLSVTRQCAHEPPSPSTTEAAVGTNAVSSAAAPMRRVARTRAVLCLPIVPSHRRASACATKTLLLCAS
mmetsp:Transcript_104358/g.292407  ORF Transcript_104358/g.292407 Transcript_104358/m.292407 type:complete len:225 (-) Transcript_104358:43-717(-)